MLSCQRKAALKTLKMSNTVALQSGHHISLFSSLNTPFHLDRAKLKPLPIWNETPLLNPLTPLNPAWALFRRLGVHSFPLSESDEELNKATVEILRLHCSNFIRKTFWCEQIFPANTYGWRETCKRSFIHVSTGQRQYIPLVANHRGISGTVERSRGRGGGAEKKNC